MKKNEKRGLPFPNSQCYSFYAFLHEVVQHCNIYNVVESHNRIECKKHHATYNLLLCAAQRLRLANYNANPNNYIRIRT